MSALSALSRSTASSGSFTRPLRWPSCSLSFSRFRQLGFRPDGDFERAGRVLRLAHLGLGRGDLLVELLDLHRQLRPQAVLLAELIDLGPQPVALRGEVDDPRRLPGAASSACAIGAAAPGSRRTG